MSLNMLVCLASTVVPRRSMRGRRGQASSSVYQKKARMAQRKHQRDEDRQDDGAVDDRDDEDEFSSSLLPAQSARNKRSRERKNKSKPNEMTEEEMMDLALRLSKQEASITASKQQQEDEAMLKAVQESMSSQTQLFPPSQSLLTDAEASLRLCSRRKLLYSNGKKTCDNEQGGLKVDFPPNTDLKQESKESGDEMNTRNKKRKRKEESPLPEMPDLSQTQKIYSQTSPCSSESLSVPLDSPKSSDLTEIDDCQLHKSSIFPLIGHRTKVYIPRLSQELLETCKKTGFVLCSQDSWTSTQKFMPAQQKSPTFPKSPSSFAACPKSPVFSETDQGDDGETELNPECAKAPAFGRNAEHEKSPSACNSHLCENTGSMLSSQESLTSSMRSTAHQPKSPVFSKSPVLFKNFTAASKSPVFSETKKRYDCSTSPVFGRTGRQQQIDPNVEKSLVGSSTEKLRGSNGESNSPGIADQDGKTDAKINTSSKSDDSHMLNEMSKDFKPAETDLSSVMMLVWSDEEDDDVTPVGSPSPVFPEERPIHQNHMTAGAPQVTAPHCRLSTTEQESQPVSSQGTVRRPLAPFGESAGGPTVHYYWGVPFCPQGLDPDSYTQVILAQMEVYEKSLKQAQRCLLRKAEWGEPILPQPEKSPSPESPAESPHHRGPRSLRLRVKRPCEAADSSPAETEEGEDKNEEDDKEKNEGQYGEERQVDTDDGDVCPETQLSDSDSTQDLTMVADNGAQPRRESRELPGIETILRGDSPAVDQQRLKERMEVDSQMDGKAKGSNLVRTCETVENGRDRDVEEVKDQGLQRWESPELEPAVVPQSPESTLDCPICQRPFPVTEIEIHAAYCDGEVAVVDERRPKFDSFQTSLKPQRKRTRRAAAADEETNTNSDTGRNQEKCYVCQKAVPLRDYNSHTEHCIQQQLSKTDAKGNLLSALEQTECRDSEAGPSKLQPGDVIDLRDDDDEDEGDTGVSVFRISNSPIRSFTPISEATDCLIDFKKQQRAKKPSRRRR
ncbi:hypothetical protein Q8A73_022754 [Channa argus]|nr:hypothetical protein Q8A73_022754 [Channa argus]